MRLVSNHFNDLVRGVFQYPRAERAHCDELIAGVNQQYQHFQYPRAERAHCDPSKRVAAASAAKLSVSSCGACPLRQREGSRAIESGRLSVSSCGACPLRRKCRGESVLAETGTFSILVRSVPIATARKELIGARGCNFQYPRADRAHCDLPCG